MIALAEKTQVLLTPEEQTVELYRAAVYILDDELLTDDESLEWLGKVINEDITPPEQFKALKVARKVWRKLEKVDIFLPTVVNWTSTYSFEIMKTWWFCQRYQAE